MTTVGYGAYLRLKRVEDQANKLGFEFGHSKHGARDYDGIALRPRGDAWPLYSRDAEVWYSDIEGVESFLRGLEWARTYYKMLGVATDKSIARKEQDYRNKQLIKAIQTGTYEV